MIKTSDQMAALGLIPVPLIGKRPFISGWQYASGFSRSDWERADSIALRCGLQPDGSQLVCIDFDKDRDDSGAPTKHSELIRALLTKATERRAAQLCGAFYWEKSPHGWHLIIKADTDGEPEASKKLYWDDGVCIVETRGRGSCVRVAPSVGCESYEGSLKFSRSLPLETLKDILSDLTSAESILTPFRTSTARDYVGGGVDTPADHIRDNLGLLEAYLNDRGWETLGEDDSYISMKRPAAAGGRENHSLHISKETGACVPWSSQLGLDVGAAVSPLSFIASVSFGGDEAEAARWWRINRMGATPAAKVSRATEPESISPVSSERTESISPVSSEMFDLSESILTDGRSVADLFRWSAAHFSPSMFPVEMFSGRPLLETALKRTKAGKQPQTHGTFLTCLAIASAAASRLIVGDCDGQTVHPTIYAHFFSPSGSGKGDVLGLAEWARQMFDEAADAFTGYYTGCNLPDWASTSAIDREIKLIRDAKDDDERADFFLKIGAPFAYMNEIPATSEGFTSAIVSAGSAFIIQDEIQDLYKSENKDRFWLIMQELKKLFTNQGSRYSEKITKGGLYSDEISSIYYAYVTLYGQGVLDSDTERALCAEIDGGYTGRLSMCLGVPAPEVNYNEYKNIKREKTDREWRRISPEAAEWLTSYIRAKLQKTCNKPRFIKNERKSTKRALVYDVTGEYKPSFFTVPFTSDAVDFVNTAAAWLMDAKAHSRIIKPYRSIISRKIQNLQIYSLLSAILRNNFTYEAFKADSDFYISDFTDFEDVSGLAYVTADDVRWGFCALLYELAALTHIIRPDVLCGDGAAIDERKDDDIRAELIRYIGDNEGVTKSEIIKMKTSTAYYMGTREKRRAILVQLLSDDVPEVICVQGARGRQELFLKKNKTPIDA